MKQSPKSVPGRLQEQAQSILKACLELTAMRRKVRERRMAMQYEDAGSFGGGR